jgi:hypothetical protein
VETGVPPLEGGGGEYPAGEVGEIGVDGAAVGGTGEDRGGGGAAVVGAGVGLGVACTQIWSKELVQRKFSVLS